MVEGTTCRGSYILGTACDDCSRCKEEEAKLKAEDKWPPQKINESIIKVDDKVWNQIQEELDIFSTIHLKIKDNKVALVMVFSKKRMRADIFIYINGVLKGAEEKELQEMFWNEKKRAAWSPKIKKSIIKRHGKKKALSIFPDLNETFSYYIPFFNSFSTLKNQYKNRHKEIYWIRK